MNKSLPYRVLRGASLAAMLLVFVLITRAVAWAQAASDVSAAEFKAPAWADGTVYNFGIYDRGMNRIGTAAYKIVLDPEMGINNYTIRYNAKSADMAESSTAVVDKRTLLPVRSSRKLSRGGSDLYSSTSYGESGVVVSYRKDEGAVYQDSFPAGASGSLYDFEEMFLLIPQIAWQGQSEVYFYIFITGRKSASWVTVEDLGADVISYKERIWKCRKYLVKSDIGDQYFWITTYNGRSRIAKFDSGSYYFIDLDLPSTGTQADLAGKLSLGDAMQAAGGRGK